MTDTRNAESAGATQSWHALLAADAVAAVDSDASAGLSATEAQRRLAVFGANALREPQRRALWAVLFSQFASPLIYLLFAAAGIALVLGHRSDAIVIFVVVLLNALVGAFQEGRAERSLEALRKLALHAARVVRDGQELVIAARDVVPGDVLLVEAGDAIAADARLLDGAALQLAEAALTGESVPVGKHQDVLPESTQLADRQNMVYAGTHVTAGRARAVVVATGLTTEIGRIATLAESAKEPPTPLERRIAQFGRMVIFGAVGLFLLINAVGLWRGLPMAQVLMVAISQVVGMIPEGLPVAMTIALAVGVQRMARRKAVVRRLAAVETLGSTTVICSDKTGTLTKNEMTVTALVLADGRHLEVSGVGYAPVGELSCRGQRVEPERDGALRELLEAVVLCSDAQLHGPHEEEPSWQPIGDPTEVALVSLAIKGHLVPAELRARAPRRAELPFDSAVQMMATQHQMAGGSRVIIKGAPEAVLELCRGLRGAAGTEELTAEARARVQAQGEALAAKALRVLAVAVVEGGRIDGDLGMEAFRGQAVLLGLVGQLDPPRAEAKEAVERCRAAGIRPVMVTGDHKVTGEAIARQLGISREGDLSIDGRELEALSAQELGERLARVSVFARVHPAQKLRIIEAYQRRGEVVAMTGDGVNDAPALVKADVGVAMGITGTEVAKEAAKVVVGDDNFATIVAAVEEGRVVYRNIKKAVLLLFSSSAAEVLVLVLGIVLGYPPPFLAVQILWNNLVTEGLITVNLIMEPAEGDEMQQGPVAASEPLLTRLLLTRMVFIVPAMVISALGWFAFRLASGVPEEQVRTETFTLLAICEWYNVLNCRSEVRSALDWGLLRNRWLLGGLVVGNLLQVAVVFWEPLGSVFHTTPFGLAEVVALGVVGSLVLWVEEARKWWVRRRMARRG